MQAASALKACEARAEPSRPWFRKVMRRSASRAQAPVRVNRSTCDDDLTTTCWRPSASMSRATWPENRLRSKSAWDASLLGVSTAVKALDVIVGDQKTSAFAATH